MSLGRMRRLQRVVSLAEDELVKLQDNLKLTQALPGTSTTAVAKRTPSVDILRQLPFIESMFQRAIANNFTVESATSLAASTEEDYLRTISERTEVEATSDPPPAPVIFNVNIQPCKHNCEKNTPLPTTESAPKEVAKQEFKEPPEKGVIRKPETSAKSKTESISGKSKTESTKSRLEILSKPKASYVKSRLEKEAAAKPKLAPPRKKDESNLVTVKAADTLRYRPGCTSLPLHGNTPAKAFARKLGPPMQTLTTSAITASLMKKSFSYCRAGKNNVGDTQQAHMGLPKDAVFHSTVFKPPASKIQVYIANTGMNMNKCACQPRPRPPPPAHCCHCDRSPCECANDYRCCGHTVRPTPKLFPEKQAPPPPQPPPPPLPCLTKDKPPDDPRLAHRREVMQKLRLQNLPGVNIEDDPNVKQSVQTGDQPETLQTTVSNSCAELQSSFKCGGNVQPRDGCSAIGYTSGTHAVVEEVPSHISGSKVQCLLTEMKDMACPVEVQETKGVTTHVIKQKCALCNNEIRMTQMDNCIYEVDNKQTATERCCCECHAHQQAKVVTSHTASSPIAAQRNKDICLQYKCANECAETSTAPPPSQVNGSTSAAAVEVVCTKPSSQVEHVDAGKENNADIEDNPDITTILDKKELYSTTDCDLSDGGPACNTGECLYAKKAHVRISEDSIIEKPKKKKKSPCCGPKNKKSDTSVSTEENCTCANCQLENRSELEGCKGACMNEKGRECTPTKAVKKKKKDAQKSPETPEKVGCCKCCRKRNKKQKVPECCQPPPEVEQKPSEVQPDCCKPMPTEVQAMHCMIKDSANVFAAKPLDADGCPSNSEELYILVQDTAMQADATDEAEEIPECPVSVEHAIDEEINEADEAPKEKLSMLEQYYTLGSSHYVNLVTIPNKYSLFPNEQFSGLPLLLSKRKKEAEEKGDKMAGMPEVRRWQRRTAPKPANNQQSQAAVSEGEIECECTVSVGEVQDCEPRSEGELSAGAVDMVDSAKPSVAAVAQQEQETQKVPVRKRGLLHRNPFSFYVSSRSNPQSLDGTPGH